MAIASKKPLHNDESGAAILEFTVVAGVMITVLFGIVEFSHLYSQWNAATKAVQVGARLAAVSNPVWSNITDLTGLENGGVPGDLLDSSSTYDYKVTCSGLTQTCTANVNNVTGGFSTDYNIPAMGRLVFGRSGGTCGDPPGTYFGMCDIFSRVRERNVEVIYQHTRTGYATRPGGLVPTITLQLVGIDFQFVFLDDLLGFNNVPIPGLVTTMIAEDMRSGAPTF